MLIDTSGSQNWSLLALKSLAGFVIAVVALSLFHALLELKSPALLENGNLLTFLIWFGNDIRYLCVQLVYVSGIVFVGAKFFETRTTFAVTFDRIDAGKMSVKGPDGDNIVWIGQRYGTELEAQTVAATLENRLKENAA